MAPWPLVVDVPVNISDKFLQSKEFDLLVPQIPFISRVWDIPVLPQSVVRTVQTVQKVGDCTAQFFDLLDMPVVV